MRKSTRSLLLLSLSTVLIILTILTLNVPEFHNGIPMPDQLYSASGGQGGGLERLLNLVQQSFGNLGDKADAARHRLTMIAGPLSIVVLLVFAVLFLFVGKLRRLVLMRMIASLVVMAILISIFYSGNTDSQADTGEMIITDMGENIGEELMDDEYISAEEAEPEIPAGVSYTFSFIVVLLFFLVIFLLYRKIRVMQNHNQKRSLLDVTEEALHSIKKGSDFSNVILRCYDEMTLVLKDSMGIVRGSTMTPREFRERLVMEGLPDREISNLTGLFEKVRYGKGNLTTQEEKAAESCLKAIVSSLESR